MHWICKGWATAVLLLILIVVAVSSQPAGKPDVPPPEPVAVDLPMLSTGPEMYIVRLVDEPLATYRGGITGLAATSPQLTGASKLDMNAPASIAYQKYLAAAQSDLLTEAAQQLSRPLEPLHQYMAAFNGFTLELTGAEAAQLAQLPGVAGVRREQTYQPLTDASPAWIGAPAIWEGNAAIQNKGEGIIIGVIDTGINIDHPAFADVGGDGYDHEDPLGAGVYLGWCLPANHDPAYVCNDKLIGLWDFADAYGEADGPEDSTGHGSHTASTAAGNVVTATVTTATGYSYTAPVSGIAPHANIIAYDACISSCPTGALIAAVDQAVIDGVNVINYSISGGTDPYNGGVEQAFLAAREAGVFIATAAGNSGPDVGSLAHHSPWVTTVGASTHNRRFVNSLADLTRDGGSSLADISGKSLTTGYGPAPIVYAGDYGDALCLDPFLPGTWHGEIVVCDRGTIARVDKGNNVLAGGAGGLVLVNVEVDQLVNADAHYLPAVHIGYGDGLALKTWLADESGHMATIMGTAVTWDSTYGDVMASFSSRGPNTALDVLKPDIVAPGVDVLAARNTTSAFSGPEYGLDSGTSMASPHIAGAAALLLGAYKDSAVPWTPDEIRSALMMTAVTDLFRENGGSTAVPFDRGAGRVDLSQAAQAGLVLDESTANYEAANPALGGDPQTLNLPSMTDGACLFTCSWGRTLRSTLTASTDWTVTVEAPLGMTVTVSPTTFLVPAFMTQTLAIEADVTHFNGAQGWGVASLQLSSPGQATLHMPIVVQKAYGSDLSTLRKSAPVSAEPGQVITYQIALDNLDALTHTFSLTDTLPAGVEYVPGSATGGLTYNDASRQFTWSGEVGPGTLGYEVTQIITPTYVNLGDLSILSLCDHPGLQGDCDDGALLFDLAASNGVSYSFYGESLTQIVAYTNGLLYGLEGQRGSACTACPQKFPEPTELNQVIAGLWRDINMRGDGGTEMGNWYAAVIEGLLSHPGDRMFYVNWHDAAQFGAPLTTSRNAIAIVLDGQSEPAGRIYYLYNNITNSDLLYQEGFSIGVENKAGTEGLTYAFAPCLSGACIPAAATGELPENGLVLRFDPAIVGGSSARIFTYQVEVTAVAPNLITNSVEATSDGPEPYLVALADLPVEYRSYLPVIRR